MARTSAFLSSPLGIVASVAVATVVVFSAGCSLSWNVRQEAPSEIASLSGSRSRYRVCLDGPRGVDGLEVRSTAGVVSGTDGGKAGNPPCRQFSGPIAAAALEQESVLVVHERGAEVARVLPLTSAHVTWQPTSRWEPEGRLTFAHPTSRPYSNVLSISDLFWYRFDASPLRAGVEVEVGFGHGLLGAIGPALGYTIPIAERWVVTPEAAYQVGGTINSSTAWNDQLFHGPGARLVIARVPAPFLGSPPPGQSGASGLLVSYQSLSFPHTKDRISVIAIGITARPW